jgi:lysylphosphatidylglycerol synthetase-like protein (DUF2156 family)
VNSLAQDPIALSTLDTGIERFETRRGYVAYFRAGHALTLGAPICAPEDTSSVAKTFLAQEPRASFFYLTGQQIERLELGGEWHAVPVGVDILLPLQEITSWPREVASAVRKAKRAGLVLEELRGEALTAAGPALRLAQAAYLGSREVKTEMRFLTRPCQFEQDRLGRTFGLFLAGELCGFVVVDPYRTDSGGQGYLLNLFRIKPTRLWGVYLACVALLTETLGCEGVEELSLGFVPLAEVNGALPWWMRWQLGLLRRIGRTSKYLCGLARIKHVFGGVRVPRYLLTRRKFLGRDLWAFRRAMGA